MTIQPFGDSALMLNFDQKIDEATHAEVMAMVHAIDQMKWPEITFITPAYCSITIGFDTNKTEYKSLCEKIDKLQSVSLTNTPSTKKKILEIPVHYGGDHGPDMQELSNQTGLTIPEIIDLHTSVTYRVYMIGFLPGFPYMGRLPKPLHCSRRESPRLKVPAQSVGIAGMQTGIYPSDAPGGWQIIGWTPLNIFNGKKKNPFLFQAGDLVKFYPIQ